MSTTALDERTAAEFAPEDLPVRHNRNRRPSKKVLIGAGLAVVLLAATVSAVVSGGSPSGSSKSASVAEPALGAASNRASAGTSASASATAPAAPASSTGPVASPAVPSTLPSRVIKTGSLDLQVRVGQVGSAIGRLTSLAAGDGGFVANTNVSSENGAPAYGDITLRVPAADFETLLNQVRGLGTPISVTTSSQDVTSQYVDLNARLQALLDTRTQFEQILARAQSIGDILSVEQQITDLQTQIEQLQGQLNVMNDQTTYGTLGVHVTEPTGSHGTTAAPTGLAKAWDHARHSFAAGTEAVLAALGGVAVFLVVAGAIALLAWGGWNLYRRRAMV